jgi:thiol-disulfide isomerase/thioredoxin
MKQYMKGILCGIAIFTVYSVSAQSIQVEGVATGKIAKLLKEVQFVCDGQMQALPLKKEVHTFGGTVKLVEPQFTEIRSGNGKPMYYFLVPNEKITLSIDKPSLQESNLVMTAPKAQQLQKIFDSYLDGLREKGIDTKQRDWQTLVFDDTAAVIHAEKKLTEQLAKNAKLVATVPNFKRDVQLFMKFFRNYISVDSMQLPQLERALQSIKDAKVKPTALNIPFFKEYVTDLTSAYAARTLEKYGFVLDYLKQRNVPQFIASEAIEKYISDTTVKSYFFGEKLRLELATNGLKNEPYINFLVDHSVPSVRESVRSRIELLEANRKPDMNAARKKAFDFLLHDSTGKEYRLADFKGKMLFVDFWASWCAPCKAQNPFQKELEKTYAGKDIVFMNVSLDRSKPDWLKSVKEEDLHGVILHAKGDFRNAFPQAYGIESIPRYMLIDANGYMISDNMMKPQNKKEIMGVFDEELYAKNTAAILEKHFEALGAEVLKAKGLQLSYRQSMVSFNSNIKMSYRYPDHMKTIMKFEENEQMLMILGGEFFTEKYTIMTGDKVVTNLPGQASVKNNWVNKLFGFELFLRSSVNNAVVKFAEENSSGADSSFVLKLIHAGTTEKFYINKRTYLLDKIVLNTVIEPRKGGGTMETFVAYEDYRKVDGLMIPFKINQANINTMKVQEAIVKPMSDDIFTFKVQ